MFIINNETGDGDNNDLLSLLAELFLPTEIQDQPRDNKEMVELNQQTMLYFRTDSKQQLERGPP